VRRFSFIALLVVLAIAVGVIVSTRGGSADHAAGTPSPSRTIVTPSPSVSSTETPAASVTPPATPAVPPPTKGPATASCVEGWQTPADGTPAFTDPLGIIRRTTRVKGPLTVVDMRRFVGPESPPSEQGYLLAVERWYIKLYAVDDPAFQGRFLVESRRFGRGLSAVAPYDSRGFRSPDWIGFQFDSADIARKTYPGLPGAWSGIPYDFVKGGAGLKFPGLPAEVMGCLEGT
jgi:hypothetical protein